MKKSRCVSALLSVALLSTTVLLVGCGEEESSGGIEPKLYTDSLFAVMNADRANYTKLVVQRLGPNGVGAIKPDEHWKEIENGTLLPAQMFRAGAEAVAEVTDEFSYSLQSIWPINSQNAPRTEMEKEGLQFIADNPGENFYGTESLGDVDYFTAVYPDVAVSEACTKCHNDHKDSPKNDFKIGEVMGGVVIRVPL
ncbi:MAG: Tll0287-like domain-containing protein [Cellvibrionaceae bacterium]